MSNNFAVLPNAASGLTLPSRPPQPMTGPDTYRELIRRLFHSPSAVAIVGCGMGAAGVCDGIATELAASGKRVVVVPVDKLLRMNPLPVADETTFSSGSAPSIWLWPAPAGQKIELFKSREPATAVNWLDSLRRNFDAVLLDCPAAAPGVTEIAAMADAAVLVVEAGRTPRQKILLDQRALQLAGVKLAGCVLAGYRAGDSMERR